MAGNVNNLKPWKKGCPSPNPLGRPKKKIITEIYERMLESGQTKAAIERQVLKTLTEKGMAGVLLIKEIADRVDGPVKQELELSGEMTYSQIVINARKRRSDPNTD